MHHQTQSETDLQIDLQKRDLLKSAAQKRREGERATRKEPSFAKTGLQDSDGSRNVTVAAWSALHD